MFLHGDGAAECRTGKRNFLIVFGHKGQADGFPMLNQFLPGFFFCHTADGNAIDFGMRQKFSFPA